MIRLPEARAHKYHAERVIVDGHVFDSAGEAARWGELCYLEKAGEITELARQVPFLLHVGSPAARSVIGTYVADFTYSERVNTSPAEVFVRVVEDFKGYDTALSRWKRRHVELEYGITVRLTRAALRR